MRLFWLKAHTCDNLPIASITDQIAEQFGIDRKSIVCNRIADEAARQTALDNNLPINPKVFFSQIGHEVFVRQCFLAELNRTIGDELAIKNFDIDDFSTRFPQWDWHPIESDFDWIPRLDESVRCVRQRLEQGFGLEDATTLASFFASLRWKQAEHLSVGYVELAFIFYRLKFTLSCVCRRRLIRSSPY